MSTKELDYDTILKFRNGEEPAFTAIYNHFYTSIFSFCKHLLPTIEDARDMTAQLFIMLWEKRETVESATNLRNFLFLNARNKCLNFLRNQKARTAIDKEIGQFALSEQRLMFFAEIESELITRIREDIEGLPEYYRNILKLSYFQGYNNQEIANLLDISEKTVRNAKSIALKTMKMVLLSRSGKLGFTITCIIFFKTSGQ